jgi:mycoredoxin
MSDENDVIGRDVYPLPVLMYGRADCEYTAQARRRLQGFEIPFVEFDIDEDEEAARYVERINHGEQLTPTIVFGDEDFILARPDMHELDQALQRAGYQF